jgi:PAS domain S-box-containing protein
MNKKPGFEIDIAEFSKIQWKAQFIAHILIGMPMGLLAVISWGVPIGGPIGVAVIYALLYIFIYFPLHGIVPFIVFRRVAPLLKKISNNDKLSQKELDSIVGFLANYPLNNVPRIILIEISAFALGALFWWIGYVPELNPIMNIAIFETFVLGIVVGFNESILHFGLLETKTRKIIEQILKQYDYLPSEDLPVYRISLYKKVLVLVVMCSVGAALSITLFFTSYLAIASPELLWVNAIYILIAVGLTVMYVIVLAPIISKNFTQPLQRLIDWSQSVTNGDLKKRLHFLTNDETLDLIIDSNQMVNQLVSSDEKLKDTLKELRTDRDLISNERNTLNAVISEIEEGIVAVDPAGKIILINKPLLYMLGMDEGACLNKEVNEVLKIKDASEELVEFKFLINEDNKKTSDETTFKIENNRHQTLYANISVRSVKDIHDNLLFHLTTVSDLTKATQFEEMKLDFVSMAAHELRTPLTSIRGYLSLFIEDKKEKLDESDLSDLNRISLSAGRLSDLIDTLLNVSRIERGDFSITAEKVEWISFAKNQYDLLQASGVQKGITMQFENPHFEEIYVNIDPHRINEVLSNLISNAITFTDRDGHVTVKFQKNDSEIITEISDTGVGISEEAQKNLFTKFYRVKHSLEMSSPGTGLGLFVSKSIIEMHKGKMWVESKVGQGSKFYFSLPIVK